MLTLLALALLAQHTRVEDPWDGDLDTVLLDRNNFTSFIQNNTLVMVEFMTTWCGHCRQFAPHYAATATELKKDGIPCAKINMDDPVNHPFAGEYSLSGFPAMFIFKRMYDSDPNDPLGTKESWPHTSDGPDEKEKVILHMRNIGKAPQRHKSADALTEFIEENVHYSDSKVGVILLGIFQDKKNANYEAFKEAKFGRPYPKFVWVKDAMLAAKYISEEKAASLAATKKDAVFVVSWWSLDSLRAFSLHLPRMS